MDMLQETFDIQRRNAIRLISAGCKVTPATDSYLGDAPEFRRVVKTEELEPGSGTVLAIEGFVELGMTPMQAIVAATANGAGAAFRSRDLGTIEKGKVADLVLLEADPLADIHNIEKISAVVAPRPGRRFRQPAGASDFLQEALKLARVRHSNHISIS